MNHWLIFVIFASELDVAAYPLHYKAEAFTPVMCQLPVFRSHSQSPGRRRDRFRSSSSAFTRTSERCARAAPTVRPAAVKRGQPNINTPSQTVRFPLSNTYDRKPA